MLPTTPVERPVNVSEQFIDSLANQNNRLTGVADRLAGLLNKIRGSKPEPIGRSEEAANDIPQTAFFQQANRIIGKEAENIDICESLVSELEEIF